MTKLHRTGFFVSLSTVAFAFLGFWIAGTVGVIEFSSGYFWGFVILPLAGAGAVTGLSLKWPIIGGCIGVLTPLAFFFTHNMEAFYRYLYLAAIIVYFTGGILLLAAAIKDKN
jgi:hypothetical protein